ncbi:MAG TPA: TIGR02466 family protein [Xanthobacteraceae bacterium]|nr:TIGR02466 family protein [Xanthobacteraceae bacterium]
MLDIPKKSDAKELTAKQMYMLFPTPMFTGKLPDISLCDRIEKKLQELRAAGKGVFSPEGAILAYMTPDNIQTLPEMKDLVDVIMEESGIIFDTMAIKRDSHYITNMCANIANPNRRHFMHMHPNCLLSGLVYIKTPKNCGSTAFASPRLLSKNLEPTFWRKNELNSDVFIVPAEKGRMVIWPSHIPHSVEQGSADETEERIVVAFNIMIRGLIDLPTARLNLA